MGYYIFLIVVMYMFKLTCLLVVGAHDEEERARSLYGIDERKM